MGIRNLRSWENRGDFKGKSFRIRTAPSLALLNRDENVLPSESRLIESALDVPYMHLCPTRDWLLVSS